MTKDYISREYLLAEYDRQHKGPPGGARKIIAEAPAADVVEVVRCRECVYWEPASPTRTSGNCNRSFEITAWATDFCSYGKRKDGGQEDGKKAIPLSCDNP